ncbi:hypothetical protein AWRI3579_g2873 [Hanseniaspora osmophila]|uniref:HMG box domain-containing protein n=1 Tax=Hanseniaspora osmophila TaxID=56408 RepID=A0A1E5RBU9_9ASCO|nr:hypothetical protein AWRI3579_g2873 [Hanseniaspora osmophila]
MYPVDSTNKFTNHQSPSNGLLTTAQCSYDINSLTKNTSYNTQKNIDFTKTNTNTNTNTINNKNSTKRLDNIYPSEITEVDLTKGVPTPQSSPMMGAWHDLTSLNDCSSTSKPISQYNSERKRSSVYDLSTILNHAYDENHSIATEPCLLDSLQDENKLHKKIETLSEEKDAKRCCCKQANKKKIIVKPQNPFILFRHNFQKILTKYITLEDEYSQKHKRETENNFFVELDSTKKLFTSEELENCCFKNLFELDFITHECLYENVNFVSENSEKLNISSSLAKRKNKTQELSQQAPKIKVSKISQFASKKWLAISPKTKLYWKTLANDAKKEYELKHGYFGNGHRVKKIDASILKNNSLSGRKNNSIQQIDLVDNATVQNKFELCAFCKKQLELNPNVTRSTSWNQVYYEVQKTTINIKEIMEKNNIPNDLGLSLQNYDPTQRFVFTSNKAPTSNQVNRRNAVAEHEILQNTSKKGYTFVDVSKTFLETEDQMHETFTKQEMESSILTDYLNGITIQRNTQHQ